MIIHYWVGFSKRRNSTKQPNGGIEVNVNLKDDTSILSPTFDCIGVPATVNYIYCPDFGRYYYVSDITRAGKDRLLIRCEADPMATYKSAIGYYTGDIEYTASSNIKTILDPRNKPTCEILTKDTNIGTLPTFDTTANCFIVGVADSSGISYYMMNATKCANLLSEMYDKSLNGQLTRDFFDMTNVLISACVMPRFPLSGDDTITIGNPQGIHIDLLSDVYRINPTDRMITLLETTEDIYYPSDDLGLGISYLDIAPYSTGVLFLPFVGCVDLDLGSMVNQKSLYIKATLDQINGDIVYKIGLDSDTILSTYSGNCAANVPVCGSSYNPIGAATGIMSMLGGVASLATGLASGGAGGVIAGVSAIAGGGSGLFNSLSHHTQINGSLSSYIGSSLGLNIHSTVFTRKPSTTDLTEYKNISGMPYFKTARINTLAGYVKCADASIDIAGYGSEKEAVNSYLNNGFYYE